MDLRTKLSLALVFVSLASMTLLGVFAYATSATLLQEISLRQLDALAESKKRDLIKVYEGWEDNLRLVRNRTQLRTSMRNHLRDRDDSSLREIERIIEGITLAVPEIDRLIVLDRKGDEITSFGHSGVTQSTFPLGDDIGYVGTFVDEGTGVRVALNTPVELDGQMIGGIQLIVDASDLSDITGDYTGLGETGEAIVLMRQGEDSIQVLTKLRHEPEARFPEIKIDTSSEELLQLFVVEEVPAQAHLDYRNEWVWSATRIIPGLGWGLVVKVDVEEEGQRANVLREALFDIALSLSAFAIIGGALLGYYLARPIQELASVVQRVRHNGEAGGVRAEVKGKDEVAMMAESFNEFLDHLESERAAEPPDA